VSTEALIFAMTAVVRPTSTAALIAMLSARRPQRLLVAYIFAGLAFSIAVGVLVVVLLGGLGSPSGSSRGPVIDTVLGLAALGYATAVGVGWLSGFHDGRVAGSSDWMRSRLQHLSPAGAAAAGVLTHLPGLVYLAALNAIAGDSTGTLDGVLQVVVYNAIWFSTAIVALVLSVNRPTAFREGLAEMGSWARRHERMIIVVLFGALGGYLLVVGLLGLRHPAA
jgi:hypothetical protein